MGLLSPLFADNAQHRLGIRRLFQRLPELGFVQKFGDVGKRVEMFLELALWHKEKHDELDRLVVERVEIHAGAPGQRDLELGGQLRQEESEHVVSPGEERIVDTTDTRTPLR